MTSSTEGVTALVQHPAPDIEKATLPMPWPSHQPMLTVPFFDREMYKTVNLNAPPSEQSDGLDLPFSDIATLRFFFNIGVQQSRAILLSQLHAKLAIAQSNQPTGVALECSQRISSAPNFDSSKLNLPWSFLKNVPCERPLETRDTTKHA